MCNFNTSYILYVTQRLLFNTKDGTVHVLREFFGNVILLTYGSTYYILKYYALTESSLFYP